MSEVDIFQLKPQEQLAVMVRRLIRFGTDMRLLARQLPPAEAEKLAQAKVALERAERLIAELAEAQNPNPGRG
jgi:hypothetical protein